MDLIWLRFLQWFAYHLKREEVAILVAYNGETCNLEWLWKLTQAPRSLYCLPPEMEYFMDPLMVIRHFTGCLLHPIKSKLDSLELGVVWKYITKSNINGAHDSLVDAKAQSDIILHPSFVPYLNKGVSIQLIMDIFTKTQTR